MGQFTDVVRRPTPPPPIADYAAARASFRWETVAAEAGADPASLNIGALATERQVAQGRGLEHALLWHGAQGEVERFSYGDLVEASGRAANVLAGYDVQPGDCVVFLLPNVPELHIGVLAALRLGAHPVVLGGGRSLEHARGVLLQTRPRALLTTTAFRNVIDSLRPFVPELRTVFLVERGRAGMSSPDEGEALWKRAYDAASAKFETVATRGRDPAYIAYPEQGVLGSAIGHDAALALLYGAKNVLESGPGETVVPAFMPGEALFVPHAILGPLVSGSTLVALEDPARFGRFAELAAQSESCGWFSSFKAIDVMLRLDPNLAIFLKKCRNIACTWPYDPFFIQMTMMSYGSPVHGVWAERELGTIQCAELRGTELRPGSAGRPMPGVDLRIVNEAGEPVGAGVKGKLEVKIGPGAPFVRFWNAPEETEKVLRDGWFRTGRSAKVDPESYVWIDR